MSKFTYHVDEQDLAFIKGLATGDRLDGGFKVKVPANQPCILYDEHNVISIINPDEDADYHKLYAINTTAIGGYEGVFALDEEEALDMLADWTEEHAPGLVQTYEEALDDSDGKETWVDEFCGPVGNHGLYFTERGHGPVIVEVKRD